MTELPENIDLQWIGRTLLAVQNRLATFEQLVTDVRDDMRAMREQVDVVVMTSLRLERGMASLRDDVRQLRQRVDRLEIAR
ncbi:MAG TPA: hypothetical protein VMB83_12055 [Roseiarcus sp.]|nr:hypothetical protein [Roseiarcus sp.]